MDEAVVLIMAMHNSNMPKFLIEDAALFTAIVSDLFPATAVPEHVSTGPSYSCLPIFTILLVALHGLYYCIWVMQMHRLGDLLLSILKLELYGRAIKATCLVHGANRSSCIIAVRLLGCRMHCFECSAYACLMKVSMTQALCRNHWQCGSTALVCFAACYRSL